MLKTSDGYELKKGMWISSTSGIYEVTRIESDGKMAWIDEVLFDDEDGMSDAYHLEGNPSMVVKGDMHRYSFE